MKTPKYEYDRGINGEWYWHLKAPNGQIVSSGEGYKTEAGVQRGIEAHRRIASTLRVVRLARP